MTSVKKEKWKELKSFQNSEFFLGIKEAS